MLPDVDKVNDISSCEMCKSVFSGGWEGVCPDFVLPQHLCGLVLPEDDDVVGCDTESCICILTWSAKFDAPEFVLGCLGEIKAVLVDGSEVDWREWTLADLRVCLLFSTQEHMIVLNVGSSWQRLSNLVVALPFA